MNKIQTEFTQTRREETLSLLRRLQGRLVLEGELVLAKTLEKCQQPVNLLCAGCGAKRVGHTHCKQKWCPACARMVAARRADRVRAAVEKFKWPLFVTLTMRNSKEVVCIREMRRAFGKLRRTKLWKHAVTGGVAAMEVTNQGKGWHPHIHAVIDCRWLAHRTPEPQRGMNRPEIHDLCMEASQELNEVWQKCLQADYEPILKVKRTTPGDIVVEILKYSVKGSDLIESKDRIGDLIRMMQQTRMVTTFGSVYRLKKEEPDKESACPCGNCAKPTWTPEDILMAIARRK